MSTLPLSLYVHIPWCVRKCPYCDFNSHEAERLPVDEYVAALLEDMQRDAEWAYGRPLQSIFFGGGTPSLFGADAIGSILRGIESQLRFAVNIEITLEANPGTAEYDHLKGYSDVGVNRLSFGVQSFNDAHLQALGRIHSSAEVYQAYDAARRAGFDNINLDLMHGLPQQTPADARADLVSAVALAPEHLSWYQLTIEPNTVFYRRPPVLPVEDQLADIQDQGLALLADAGYAQYEISAFGRPGRACRHNLNYWQFGDYLAVGAGAHGKITAPDGSLWRYWKTRKPADYLAAGSPYTAGRQAVARAAQPLEFMMNALRLSEGVPAALFAQRTQCELQHLAPVLAELRQRGLMTEEPERLCATALGARFLNDVLAAFEVAAD